jgi:hypothetical protein
LNESIHQHCKQRERGDPPNEAITGLPHLRAPAAIAESQGPALRLS